MNSNRPYLIRALFEWICDNDCTPYLLIDANHADVQVPTEHVEQGRIVLSIAPRSVRGLELGNERIAFDARFGGREFPVSLPVTAVQAIYAKETGEGMTFAAPAAAADADAAPPEPKGDSKSHLKVVK
ncbi:MAG: ClpXP protease specificity-enhancing factor [Pseudomonadota bacterium]